MRPDIWRWVRPSWARLYTLALAAPALWFMWLLLGRDSIKAVTSAALVGWLVFIFRAWFWYEKPRVTGSLANGIPSTPKPETAE